MKSIEDIQISPVFAPLANYVVKEYENKFHSINNLVDETLPHPLSTLLVERPKTIEELNSGMLFDSYEFKTNDKQKLGLLGFFNVNIDNYKKVIVTEYLQYGTKFFSGEELKFAIGARMMLRVDSYSLGAKLNSPQQITASVIFGKASVSFSIATLGITGPCVAGLVKAGKLNDDSYSNFIKDVSVLIANAYKKNSNCIINPQPIVF
jgi:hypothetical protein